jgi:two-component system, chemotaxis family, CheB/CheR fusion protein
MTLSNDARAVLQNFAPIEREIEGQSGVWFMRRTLPYRTHDGRVEGVVITFTDITDRKRAARALEMAGRQAELASIAKSRFLASASHDLRQPLQTLGLLQEQLAKVAVGEKAEKLVTRLDRTLGAMSGMLNTLLDINQIEAGTVRAEIVSFPINDLLGRLQDEFAYQAEAQGLALRMIPCGLWAESDPRLLEQMIRNLLSNAFKYTMRGKVLLGCRRHRGKLSIEIWDTGKGIPANELEAIFEEYHQLGNADRDRSLGLGLGLSIVQRLASLLGHRVSVRSHLGKGSVFAIEVGAVPVRTPPQPVHPRQYNDHGPGHGVRVNGTVLIIEDDPGVREHLQLLIGEEGHQVLAAADGVEALDLIARGALRPDVTLADYNLPNGMNGLQVVAKLRQKLHRALPAIILTGDISSSTLRDIALEDCVQLTKPVKMKELMAVLHRLLHLSQSRVHERAVRSEPASGRSASPVIFVVDDDPHVREEIRNVLGEDRRIVETYSSCEDFVEAYHPGREACMILDAYLPGMSGVELLHWISRAGYRLPAIMITGRSDVKTAVRAMKAGAVDFIEKPISGGELRDCVARALEQAQDLNKVFAWRETAARQIAALTQRQREIMELVLAGHPSKNIAADLGISQRTVENHRASIMKKTGAKSLPALARLVLAAS